MLPQRGPKMLPELFEVILGCPRIREKPERKSDGHNFNITVLITLPPPLGLEGVTQHVPGKGICKGEGSNFLLS